MLNFLNRIQCDAAITAKRKSPTREEKKVERNLRQSNATLCKYAALLPIHTRHFVYPQVY